MGLLLVFFFLSNVSSTYISGDIYISQTGLSRLDIQTDIPLNISNLNFQNNKLKGETPILTSKTKETWTFELNLPKYDSVLIDIHLPPNLKSIININGKNYLLDIDKKIITLLNSDSNFKISYTLEENLDYQWIIYLFFLMILIGGYILYKKLIKRKEHLGHIMPLINEKEQQIIELLMKCPIRQKEIRKKLDLPKASFSRYLLNLEKKKLIIREGEGKNKIVRLK